jgi:hypothetical protein
MGALPPSGAIDLGAVDWTTVAPYVAAGVALLVGVLSARNANRTLKNARDLASEERDHQRALAHDGRLWERRAEVYVELLMVCGEGGSAAQALRKRADAGEVVEASEIKSVGALPAKLRAQVDAFGSNEIVGDAIELQQRLRALAERERGDLPPDKEYDPSTLPSAGARKGPEWQSWRESLVWLSYVADQLLKVRATARKELQPDSER